MRSIDVKSKRIRGAESVEIMRFAAMLSDLAEVLEVSVADLLGAEKVDPEQTDAVVEQLSRINEQLVVKNRRAKRIWKTIIIITETGLEVGSEVFLKRLSWRGVSFRKNKN